MFERYTEKARRVIFYSRYEASHFGSHEIDTEHLLLGLIRENKHLDCYLPKSSPEQIRRRIEECTIKQPPILTAVDLPLSSTARHVLKHAANEADFFLHKHIGTEHIFLGLLDEPTCLAAQLMVEAGAERSQIADALERQEGRLRGPAAGPTTQPGAIRLHGIPRNAAMIRQLVERCRMYNWHWRKRSWTDVDIVIEKKTGEVSFETSLSENPTNFELVKGGQKKDHCVICRWEFFESRDGEHGIGYTNGHDWICTECYSKFFERRDFLNSAYPDIT